MSEGTLDLITTFKHTYLPFPTQVRNLEERIKPPQLVEALTEIFSEYGNIIDLVAKSNLKAKGQAFVVFDDVSSATKAIEEVNGFELFDKPMVLDFAKTRSDKTVLKEEGEGGLEAHKRRRLAEKGIYFPRFHSPLPASRLSCCCCSS